MDVYRIKNSDSMDSDIRAEDMILRVLGSCKIIRRKELIDLVKKEGDYAIPTITEHLQNLKSRGLITTVKYDEAMKYDVQTQDKKAVFYLLPSETSKAKYFDAVIAATFDSKNPNEKRAGLNELLNYAKFTLSPEQLDKISDRLPKENPKIWNNLLDLIINHANKNRPPKNRPVLERNLCHMYSTLKAKPNSEETKAKIIFLLGYLNSVEVINLLKSEITQNRAHDSDAILTIFSQPTIGKVMENHQLELFMLMKTLDKPKYELVDKIRKKGAKNIGFHVGKTKAELWDEMYEKVDSSSATSGRGH